MVKKTLRKILPVKTFESILDENEFYNNGVKIHDKETQKRPFRYDLINYLLSLKVDNNSTYLEIGVRNPSVNFNKINCKTKYSVDPGIEFKENPVDFKFTSDVFFQKLSEGEILSRDIKFDVIFIDGLHLAEQVERDIINALRFIKDDGFIVLHDCNPPSEYHAREEHTFTLSPARNTWNGTVWKAFYKMRFNQDISCFCIDSDWGIGVINKTKIVSHLTENINPFFEYKTFEKNRKVSLNLMSFEEFKELINSI